MAYPFTSYKRPFEHYEMESNGREKWQKTSLPAPEQSKLKVPPGWALFRVLCPSLKSGNVIGKGGNVVAKIRRDTGAKIKLEDAVPWCEERVALISGSIKDSKHDDSEKDAILGENGEDNTKNSIIEASKLEKATSLVQKALFLVFEKIMEGEPDNDDGDEVNKKNSPFIRLIIFHSQVGCLLGKGGNVIKRMSADSGAQIRILPKDQLPLCASPPDEIAQIKGGLTSIRKALQLVSQMLLENPPNDRDFRPDSPPGSSSHPHAPIRRPEAFNSTNYDDMQEKRQPYSYRPSYDTPKFTKPRDEGPHDSDVIVFRLMCSNVKVGSVIGKGGSIVKTLQYETGCEIKALETETEDRVIVISGPVLPGDGLSPPQDAVLRVQHRILMAAPGAIDNAFTAKLLVSSNQTGCLLGKGGSIIEEMKKLSGAHIRILSQEHTLKGVPESDEIVQVTGEFRNVKEALLQITDKLKNHFLREKAPALTNFMHPSFSDSTRPFDPYLGRKDPSPPSLYAERFGYHRAIHGSGISPLGAERAPPVPWSPHGMREDGRPISDFSGVPSRRMDGFHGLSRYY